MRGIKGLTDKGQIKSISVSHWTKVDLKGALLTCLKPNFFHQDKYQYFIRIYLNPSLGLFITPCKALIITS